MFFGLHNGIDNYFADYEYDIAGIVLSPFRFLCVIAFCLFSSNAIEQNLHQKNACKIFTFEFVLSVHLFMIGIKACYVRMCNKALNYNYVVNVWNSAILFKRGRKRCRKDNEFYLEFNGTQRTMYIIYYAKLVLSNPTVPNSLYTYSRIQ